MKGFTLIEMIVALMILSSSVILLSRMKSGNKNRIDKSYHYHKAVLLLEQKITELELEWSSQSFDSIPTEQKGQFTTQKDFSWSVKTKPLSMPSAEDMFKSLGADSDIVLYIIRTTSEFLTSSIKEVKVTVHYNKHKKKSSYSLSTYIVDYSKNIPFAQLLLQLQNSN